MERTEARGSHSTGGRAERWIALLLCAAVVSGWALEQVAPNPAVNQDMTRFALVGVLQLGLVIVLLGYGIWFLWSFSRSR